MAYAAIEAHQRGAALGEATTVLLDGHEPNHLPAVEMMVGWALHEAGKAAGAGAGLRGTTVSDARVDAFLASLGEHSELGDRQSAREAIEAAQRWGDDGVRVATGIVLAGVEVLNPLGVEVAVAQALNEADRVAVGPGGGPDEALSAVIESIVDPGAAPTLHAVELERLAMTWPALAGRLAALVEAQGRPVPAEWARALDAFKAVSGASTTET